MEPFVVVTGASNGIGRELAKEFARNGFDLLVASHGKRLAAAVFDFESLGARVDQVQADLATYDGVEKLYEAIRSTGRPIDAIAITAGVGVGGDFTRQTDLKDELNLIQLNVTSVVHLAKRVVRDMVERGQGRVLFTSSIAATRRGPFEAVYAASKAFELSFAEALRNELKDTDVTVTALRPGPTDTEFFHRAGLDDTKVGAGKKDDPAQVARQGFEALMAGRDKVVAGSMMNKLQAAASKVLPDTARAAAHRKMSEPGSADR